MHTRALTNIIEEARPATCWHCWADGPVWPCALSRTSPDGFNLVRFARGCRWAPIGEADTAAILAAAGPAFTDAAASRLHPRVSDAELAGEPRQHQQQRGQPGRCRAEQREGTPQAIEPALIASRAVATRAGGRRHGRGGVPRGARVMSLSRCQLPWAMPGGRKVAAKARKKGKLARHSLAGVDQYKA
jgi:hypothetical protein